MQFTECNQPVQHSHWPQHAMHLSPFRQNFEKNRNRQKYHHSLKEHATFTKIAKFGCEMLQTVENIALQISQILYTFVLRVGK